MMAEKALTTENRILEEAEKEFLDKGFDRAKISTIAKNANVNHAMLHYYFRTKDNIFNIIFKNKIELLAYELGNSFDDKLSFMEQLENAIESHFKFVEKNPNIIFFVLREISSDSEQMKVLRKLIKPRVEKVLAKLDKAIELEVKKGTIKPISAVDLFMNIVTLNAASVLASTIFIKVGEEFENGAGFFLQHRRDHIKKFVIDSLKL